MPTQKLSPSSAKLKLRLGGISPGVFMRDYWQKKPLLVRQAFANFAAPLTGKEILTLAKREHAESRLITRRGVGKNAAWHLQQGPLTGNNFRAAADSIWTVLVQDTQHFSHEAQQLLQCFNFIPNARLDDLMVSYAVRGGGVGPHLDSYDVFLVQGQGQRRWQISRQQNLRLKPDLPLKILAQFKAEEDWILNTGDMLYLPPGVAHHGVAQTDDCVTWSIGCRAPSQQEIADAFLDYLRDEIKLNGQYRDPDLRATTKPGAISADMLRRVSAMLADVRKAVAAKKHVQQFFGRLLTEPKSHVYFDAPVAGLTLPAFAKCAGTRGLTLDLKTRLLYDHRHLYLNGEIKLKSALKTANCRKAWCVLADTRTLTIAQIKTLSPAQLASFYDAYCDGLIHIIPAL